MANTLKFGNGEWYGKKDTILAYNDENKNYKPLPFDFSRGSSATVVNKDGLIETVGSGEPRIDYKDNSKGALLLEPSRSNLLTLSQAFDNSYWTKSGSSVVGGFTSPSADSPLGAFKLVENTVTTTHQIQRSSSFLDAKYSLSAFVKADERNWIKVNLYDGSSSVYSYFDLTNGVVGQELGASGKIENYGNGWYKCSISSTSNVSSGNGNISIRLAENNGGTGYVGNGTSGVYIFGASLEQGSYATSYIPTQGGVVTRLADTCSQTAPDGVIGQTEGTMYVDLNLGESTTDTTSTPIRFSLNNGVSSDNWIFVGNGNGDNLRVYVRANASSSVDFIKNNVFPSSGNYKIAMSFKSNEIKCYVNGVLQYNGSSGIIPNNLNSIGLGSAITGDSVSVKSQIKEYKLYNTASTDQELQALTQV